VNNIVLTTYDWLYGIASISTAFLAVVAGILAISLFEAAFKVKDMKAWRFLIFALALFGVQEVVGALKIFGVYSTPHLTHIIPSFILAFLIAALVNQIYISRGCK